MRILINQLHGLISHTFYSSRPCHFLLVGHVLKVCFGALLMQVHVVLGVNWRLTVSIRYSNLVGQYRLFVGIVIIALVEILLFRQGITACSLALVKLSGILRLVNALYVVLPM